MVWRVVKVEFTTIAATRRKFARVRVELTLEAIGPVCCCYGDVPVGGV